MDFIFAFAIAISLSMDAFAVAVSCGIIVGDFKLKHSLRLGIFFGLFQFGMPILGYLLGNGVRGFIEAYDHWVAFVMLAFIGGKMIWEAFDNKSEASDCCAANCCAAKTKLAAGRLLLLSVATSIDALIIGITIALTGREIFLTSAIIGTICLCLSVAGGMLGRFLGKTFSKYATVIGGVILVVIGAKTLIEHLTAV